jgi:bifunctional non-homologous end joining protein LigD
MGSLLETQFEEARDRCGWVGPVLVAQIKLTEWTSGDQLRQPVFLGLRTDQQPKEVVRE